MTASLKPAFLASVCCISLSAFSQTLVSGVINRYTPVIGFECDSSVLQVGNLAGFSENDEILIIQMQGAKINLQNNILFGDITDTGSVGNYEFNRISSIQNNRIHLKFKLLRPYDLSGKVQLVRVPEYMDVQVANLTCSAWNGTTGGVLTFDVSGLLTMSGKIDATAKGFRGGKVVDTNNPAYHLTEYFYPNNPDLAAEKGEGVAAIPTDHSYGRGKSSIGGGGGNAHNAGGGGGGNAGMGGNGGLEYYNTPSTPTQNTNGIGGLNLLPDTGTRALMGGGGGAGHTNDQVGSSGGIGGGIILIRAGSIQTNSFKIMANGESVNIAATDRNDGEGGGGAGGTIMVQTDNVPDVLSADAKGGNGADCFFHVNSQIIGPGGGGGGGKIVLDFPGSNFSTNVTGGLNGMANQGLTNDAMPGQPGAVLREPFWVEGSTLAGILKSDTVYFCSGDTIRINGQAYTTAQTAYFTIPGIQGCDTIREYVLKIFDPVTRSVDAQICQGDTFYYRGLKFFQQGVFIDTLHNNTGCDTLLVTSIEVSAVFSRSDTIYFCLGDTIRINGQDYSAEQTIHLDIPAVVGCDTSQTYVLKTFDPIRRTVEAEICPGDTFYYAGFSYFEAGTFTDTIPGGEGCDTMLTVSISLKPLIQSERQLLLCKGRSVQINGIFYDKPGVVYETLNAQTGCDTIRKTEIVIYIPLPFLLPDTVICEGDRIEVVSPLSGTVWLDGATGPVRNITDPGTYIATAVDSEGCPVRDTLHVGECCNEYHVYVPNIFTPNDDGENDEFCMNSIDRCHMAEMRVYDRWGSLVFQTQSQDACWDGMVRGRPAPAGVYAWLVIFTSDQTGKGQVLKGDVTLLR